MFDLFKKIISISVLVLTVTIVTASPISLDCSYATNTYDNFYYDSNCTVKTCYQQYCDCTGKRMIDSIGRCDADATCPVKNNCTIKLLNCVDKTNETNTTCIDKRQKYINMKNGPFIQYYLSCESFLCKVMNFSQCTTNHSNLCSDFISTPTSNTTNTTKTPAPLRTILPTENPTTLLRSESDNMLYKSSLTITIICGLSSLLIF